MQTANLLMVAGAFLASANFANAATYTSDGTCYVANWDPSYSDCWGFADGNVQQVDVNGDTFEGDSYIGDTWDGAGLFGYEDWVTIQDDENFSGGGSIEVGANDYSMVAVLLKSADEFAAYLFEGGLTGTLDFFTANDRDLSNYSIVGRSPEPIPLPAAGWLLIAGLGGLAAMKRRAKA